MIKVAFTLVGKVGTSELMILGLLILSLLENIKLDSDYTVYTRINSKWIMDFNLKIEIIQILEEIWKKIL